MKWPQDRLTRFEVARLLGARSLQVALGAPIFVKSEQILSPAQIAKMEFRNKILPITIKRTLPNQEESVIEIKKAIQNWLEDHAGDI